MKSLYQTEITLTLDALVWAEDKREALFYAYINLKRLFDERNSYTDKESASTFISGDYEDDYLVINGGGATYRQLRDAEGKIERQALEQQA